MPKYAQQYYYPQYESYLYKSQYENVHPNVTPINHHRNKKNKKRNPARFALSCAIILFTAIYVMPYTFRSITKSMFNPAPYENIKTDTYSLAFPSTNYLANGLFMGQRTFDFAAEGKKAKMQVLNENVNMPVLYGRLINLMQEYTVIDPSIYVWDYETGNYIDINASKTYPAASIIKIPVLIDLFKSIEAGQVTLDDKMTLKDYYRTEGSGHLQFKAENSQWTLDELARVMITDSDNTATSMITSKIGALTDLNSSIRSWGLKNTEMREWLPDYNGNNRTTTRELARMLYNIDENEKFLSAQSREKILDYMSHVHNDRLIQAGLGAGSKFYHKTGDIGKTLGDAGIVTTPNGKKYIIAILANRPHNSAAGKDFIVKASEIVYNYMVK